MRKRFKAVWDTPGIAGWATRQAAKSVWRTFPLYDFDELLAEAQFCFSKCKDKYERKVEKPAHFAALFRRTFCNRITDLSNLRTKRQRTGFNASELHADTDLMDCFQGRYSATETADLLLDFEGAPAPVLSMLKEILEGQPAETGNTLETQGGYQACNDWLCRALQLPPGTDLVGAFMARLRPAV